jgi:hypothetical protein
MQEKKNSTDGQRGTERRSGERRWLGKFSSGEGPIGKRRMGDRRLNENRRGGKNFKAGVLTQGE